VDNKEGGEVREGIDRFLEKVGEREREREEIEGGIDRWF